MARCLGTLRECDSLGTASMARGSQGEWYSLTNRLTRDTWRTPTVTVRFLDVVHTNAVRLASLIWYTQANGLAHFIWYALEVGSLDAIGTLCREVRYAVMVPSV